jgi:transposase-like protein
LGGSEGESSDIWKEILYELQKRGLKEPLLFIGDGLKGLSGAINEVYPVSDFQSCILHKVRSSLKKVRVRHKAAVGEDLKRIYRRGKYGPVETGSQELWTVSYTQTS